MNEFKTGAQLIADERISHHMRDYDAVHDAQYKKGELAAMAACYAADAAPALRGINLPWPEVNYPDKRASIDPIRELTIAGALIAAEIDRRILLEIQPAEES